KIVLLLSFLLLDITKWCYTPYWRGNPRLVQGGKHFVEKISDSVCYYLDHNDYCSGGYRIDTYGIGEAGYCFARSGRYFRHNYPHQAPGGYISGKRFVRPLLRHLPVRSEPGRRAGV